MADLVEDVARGPMSEASAVLPLRIKLEVPDEELLFDETSGLPLRRWGLDVVPTNSDGWLPLDGKFEGEQNARNVEAECPEKHLCNTRTYMRHRVAAATLPLLSQVVDRASLPVGALARSGNGGETKPATSGSSEPWTCGVKVEPETSSWKIVSHREVAVDVEQTARSVQWKESLVPVTQGPQRIECLEEKMLQLEDQLACRRAADAARKRLQRKNETPKQRARRLANDAARKRLQRVEDQLAHGRAADAARKRLQRKNETSEQRAWRLANDVARKRLQRAVHTEDHHADEGREWNRVKQLGKMAQLEAKRRRTVAQWKRTRRHLQNDVPAQDADWSPTDISASSSKEILDEAVQHRCIKRIPRQPWRRTETPEEQAQRLEASAVRSRLRLLNETPENRAKRLAAVRERARVRRATQSKLTAGLVRAVSPNGPLCLENTNEVLVEKAQHLLEECRSQWQRGGLSAKEASAERFNNPDGIMGRNPSKVTMVDICIAWSSLKEKHGCEVHVCSGIQNEGFGLFLQDEVMKRLFQSYPEYLCIDTTCRIFGCAIFQVFCEDSNGRSVVVAMCLLECVTLAGLTWFGSTFKELNAAWTKVRIVAIDPDVDPGETLASEFPAAKRVTAAIHCLRRFRREVANPGNGLTSEQRRTAIKLARQIFQAKTAEKHCVLYNLLAKVAPPDAVHELLEESQQQFAKIFNELLANPWNRLEDIAAIAARSMSLDHFFEQYFTMLRGLRSGQRVVAKTAMISPTNSTDHGLSLFATHLTDYALSHVLEQVVLMGDERIGKQGHDGIYRLFRPHGIVCCNAKFCNCPFADMMRLPCSHIFAVRHKERLCLFDEDLCNQRWRCDFYLSQQ